MFRNTRRLWLDGAVVSGAGAALGVGVVSLFIGWPFDWKTSVIVVGPDGSLRVRFRTRCSFGSFEARGDLT